MNPVLAIVAPFLAAFTLPLFFVFRKKWVGTAVILFGVLSALTALFVAAGGEAVTVMGGWQPEVGIALVVDSLTTAFLILASLGFSASLSAAAEAFGYGPWRFYVLFFLSWAATNGIILTGDLFNLFVFFEIFSVAAYLVVAYPPRSWQAIEAGFKYLIFGTVGALFLLIGIAYAFMATGQLNMAILARILPRAPEATLSVVIGCLVVGLFIKSGTVPGHFWLPDAHSSAQTPVSALLSGVFVKVSLYALIRLAFLLFGKANDRVFFVLLLFGTVTLCLGHLMAFQQEDIKRLLAYSTVAQVGTIVIAIGCASSAGVTAAVYHAFNHMAAKMGLFFVTGVLAEDRASRDIAQMGGLFRHRPLFVLAFCLFAASIAGIPPLNGFMSKWFLLIAAAERGALLPAAAVVAGTVLSAAYYLRAITAFFGPAETEPPHHRPHPVTGAIVVLLALLCLVLALAPYIGPLKEGLLAVGRDAVDGTRYIERVLR
jgi:multicomponent Na+:H+ antiporter subunit D